MSDTKETVGQPFAIRLVKLGISIAFFTITGLGSFLSWVVGKQKKASCVILYYHCVEQQHRAQFARQMDVLLRTAVPVRVGGREDLACGSRYAAVTFDDGFKSVADNAVPELIKRGIPATIFVTSDLLGQTPGWAGYPGRFMSLEELRELPRSIIDLGSHTRTHPFLPRLDEQKASDEIGTSRMKLGEMLGTECTLFAFPYGAFTPGLVNVCRRAGYQRIFTTLPYPANLGPNEFVSGRVTVEPTDWQIEFALKLRGAYRWLPLAFDAKRKLKSLLVRKAEFTRPLGHPSG